LFVYQLLKLMSLTAMVIIFLKFVNSTGYGTLLNFKEKMFK